jgi:hypothetical protein
LAKAIIRKYGKGKDYLSVEDCSKILTRRYTKLNPNRRGNTPKKVKASVVGGRK